MDCRAVIILCMAVFLAVLVTCSEGRTKKVVIHVPYKLKKMKHTHTVYKTIHHHHAVHDSYGDHAVSPTEEHEHFHHMHIHEEPVGGAHSQPVPGLSIPEFLPDVPIDIPDVPQLPALSGRHLVPLYRRT